MKPPFRYFGGKQGIASWLISLMPPHDTYVEPFAGSAAVLCAKPRVRNEVLNDLDGNVVNFFRVLRDQPDELVRLLNLTPYARDEFFACRDTLSAPDGLDDVERARRFFVQVSQSFAATPRPSTGWSTTVLKGASRAKTTVNYVSGLAAIAERLQAVTIDNRPAVDIIALYGVPGAVLYCDPPYLGETRSRNDRCRTDNAGGYAVEMMGEPEHAELAAALHDTAAAVLLSGYHSELYDDLYGDWWRAERDTVSSVAGGSDVDRARTEVVWSNRPINDGRLPLEVPA